MTLEEFEDWLHPEICRYHNTHHTGLRREPMAAWAILGCSDADRKVVNAEAFRISVLPFECRRLSLRIQSHDRSW
jgi:putative transposase